MADTTLLELRVGSGPGDARFGTLKLLADGDGWRGVAEVSVEALERGEVDALLESFDRSVAEMDAAVDPTRRAFWAADAVLGELSDRRGLRQAIEQIDDGVMEELRVELAGRVYEAYAGEEEDG